MFTRPYKIFVGKDDTRTQGVADGANINTLVQNIEDLEVVVLDKNKMVMAAGATLADTDTIYICAGTGDTFDYTEETGVTPVTAARRIIFSDPIEGALVKSFVGKAHTVKAEQVSTLDLTGLTVTEGTEYVLRVVYKDLDEHPGQFVQTKRYIATAAATIDTVGAALVASFSADKGRRVNATYTVGTDVITLTGREIPDCCTTLTDIDEFKMVEFDVFLNYVDASDSWAEWGAVKVTTAAVHGNGNWEQIRDLEKIALGYRGVSNKTHFPVKTPGLATTIDETYDVIVIEHDKSYRAPDNQYGKTTILTTVIAIPNSLVVNQMDTILTRLNPWMASLPGAFPNVAL